MKKRGLLYLLLLILLVLCNGCAQKPENIVKEELTEVKNGNPEKIQQFVNLGNLFGKDGAEELISPLFEKFDFDITAANVEKENAEVAVQITNLDMKAILADYYRALIPAHFEKVVKEKSGSGLKESEEVMALRVFRETLKGEYETTTHDVMIELTKEDGKWNIVKDEKLEGALLGELPSYLLDSSLLAPEEYVKATFDNMKKQTKEDFTIFLGLEKALSSGTESDSAVDNAFGEQILKNFNYKILSSKIETAESANVVTEITSLDLSEVMKTFGKDVMNYAKSQKALSGTDTQIEKKTNEILAKKLTENTKKRTVKVELHLKAKGGVWQLQYDEAFMDALFGGYKDGMDALKKAVKIK